MFWSVKHFVPIPTLHLALAIGFLRFGVDANFSIKLSGKLSVVVHACNPRIWEAEAEGLGNQGHLQQHSKCEDLGYIKPVASLEENENPRIEASAVWSRLTPQRVIGSE